MRFRLLALVTLSPLAGAAPTASLDDPVARAALPEFRFIPAADPASLAPAAPDHADSKTWPRSQGDNASRRYSALTQITRENIKDLAPAWTFRAGDGASNIQCTPIIVDGVLYAPTPGRALVALDAATEIGRAHV